MVGMWLDPSSILGRRRIHRIAGWSRSTSQLPPIGVASRFTRFRIATLAWPTPWASRLSSSFLTAIAQPQRLAYTATQLGDMPGRPAFLTTVGEVHETFFPKRFRGPQLTPFQRFVPTRVARPCAQLATKTCIARFGQQRSLQWSQTWGIRKFLHGRLDDLDHVGHGSTPAFFKNCRA